MADPRPLVRYDSIPGVSGPFSVEAELVSGATAAAFEGPWVPVMFCKQMSVEVSGTFSALSLQLWGSNVIEPLNQAIITIGGSVSTDDVNVLTFLTPNLPAGSAQISYKALAGNGVDEVAAGLAAAINAASASLGQLGIKAAVASAVLTVSWPSQTPLDSASQFSSPPSPGLANTLAISGSTGGSETFAFATGTDGQIIGSAITSAGFVQLTGVFRWLKARLNSFTGTSVSARMQGVG